MPYDMAKLAVPWTIHSQTGGFSPPSRRPSTEATPIMIRAAMANLTPAEVKGGRSRSPLLMTNQVLPQIRQRNAIMARTTTGDGVVFLLDNAALRREFNSPMMRMRVEIRAKKIRVG